MKSVIRKDVQELFKQLVYSFNFDEIYSNSTLISNIEKFEIELLKENSRTHKELKQHFKALFNSISEKEKSKNTGLNDIKIKIMDLLSTASRPEALLWKDT